jgi:hypothetical protein
MPLNTEHSSYDGHDPNREFADVERMLDLAATRQRPASSLVDRIFHASVDLLPSRAVVIARLEPGARPFVRSATTSRRSLRLTVWSRVALAACVAIAFGLSVNMLQRSQTVPASGPVMASTLSDDALLVMSRAGGDQLGQFLGTDAIVTFGADDEYLESFGIFGAGVDDLLGDPAAYDDTLGG